VKKCHENSNTDCIFFNLLSLCCILVAKYT